MNISEIRRFNLREIIDTAITSGNVKNETAFCELHDLNPSYISQLLKQHRNMGERAARSIERKIGVESGLLDKSPSRLSQSQYQNGQSQRQYQGADDPRLFTQIDKNFKIAHIKFAEPDDTQPVVRIPVYRDIKAACGDGFENFLEDPSDYIEMHPLVLQMLGIDSKPSNLKIIYSVEDSMWPTVPHDKPLFIDVSDKDPSAIKNGRIYVFTHRYGCRMKRIFPGYDEHGNTKSIRLASDNPDKNMFPDEWITQEQLNEINFVGRLVWTGREL